jgi:hypothetical protein
LTQTVALGFAFGGQSQLLSNPMLLNGPDGGRPAAVQMTKPHMTATVVQSRTEFLFMSDFTPSKLAVLSGGYGVTGFSVHIHSSLLGRV